MSADNITPSSAKPSPTLPTINNKASLKFSLLRSSFSLSHSSSATTSKYMLASLAAQNEDIMLNLSHHNAGIDSKPTVENRKKEANEELRRKIMGRGEGAGKVEKEGGRGGIIGEESEEDEEVGKSGVGRTKRVKREVQVGGTVAEEGSVAGKKVEDTTESKMEILISESKSGATATMPTTPNNESNGNKKKKNKKKRKAPSE